MTARDGCFLEPKTCRDDDGHISSEFRALFEPEEGREDAEVVLRGCLDKNVLGFDARSSRFRRVGVEQEEPLVETVVGLGLSFIFHKV